MSRLKNIRVWPLVWELLLYDLGLIALAWFLAWIVVRVGRCVAAGAAAIVLIGNSPNALVVSPSRGFKTVSPASSRQRIICWPRNAPSASIEYDLTNNRRPANCLKLQAKELGELL
jgi:hypothetical protein